MHIMDPPPVIELEYHTPRKPPGAPAMLFFLPAAALGGIVGLIPGFVLDGILQHYRPISEFDDIDRGVALGVFFIFIVVVAMIASVLFWVASGRGAGRAWRIVALLGAADGLISIAIFGMNGALLDHSVIPERAGAWAPLAIAIALPIVLGMIVRRRQSAGTF